MDTKEAGYLWILLFRSFRAVESIDRQSIQRLGFDSISDFAVLEILFNQGKQPVNTIGKKVMLTSGSITSAVDRLQKKGWVERIQDSQDRRIYWVDLTESGHQRIASCFETHLEDLREIFKVLEHAESIALASLLKKLGKHAEALNG
ncbi:MAG: MarR family winged helix-turn-helix transcriptional regulator [Opitutales bacterium]